jgi:hypothetical protein
MPSAYIDLNAREGFSRSKGSSAVDDVLGLSIDNLKGSPIIIL